MDKSSYLKNGDFGLYRNEIFEQYRGAMRSGDYSVAFRQICQVIYIDLSGLQNDEPEIMAYIPYDEILESMIYMLPDRSHPFLIAPFVIGDLGTIADKLGMDDEAVATGLLAGFQGIDLPRHLLTKEECVQATMAELHERKTELRTIYSAAKKRLKEQIREERAKRRGSR